MFEMILAVTIVVIAATLVGRSMYRAISGKRNCSACIETCPLSPDCDVVSCTEDCVHHMGERAAGTRS